MSSIKSFVGIQLQRNWLNACNLRFASNTGLYVANPTVCPRLRQAWNASFCPYYENGNTLCILVTFSKSAGSLVGYWKFPTMRHSPLGNRLCRIHFTVCIMWFHEFFKVTSGKWMSNIQFAGLLQTSISSVNFPDFSNYLIYGGFFLFGSTVVNFSLMSPKLVRT